MENKDIEDSIERKKTCVITNKEIAKLNVIGIDLAVGKDYIGYSIGGKHRNE